MSAPRLLLVPTHRTALADAVAAALAEIFITQGRQVRYHHLGPVGPAACWDRWEGSSFLDPALYSSDALLALYQVATRGADLSLLSCDWGVLDRRGDVAWTPADVARTLDCPVLLLVDCRQWGNGMRLLTAGLRVHLNSVNLAGVVLSGVADNQHMESLRAIFAAEDLPVVGCLFAGDGPVWDATPPGAWGLPLDADVLAAVERQVDTRGIVLLAGQRGFLPAQNPLADRGTDGPLVVIAGGKGFGVWSRDSIEALRAAGAQVRRLDLLEDAELPDGTAGLILAGSVWPAALADIAMNPSLLESIGQKVRAGMPTLALGGGSLLLLDKVHDLLGRTSEMAGLIQADAEILWELDQPQRVEVVAERDNPLFGKGERVPGWLFTDAEITDLGDRSETRPPAVRVYVAGDGEGRLEGVATDSLLCSTALVHLAAKPGMASGFVRRCAGFASGGR